MISPVLKALVQGYVGSHRTPAEPLFSWFQLNSLWNPRVVWLCIFPSLEPAPYQVICQSNPVDLSKVTILSVWGAVLHLPSLKYIIRNIFFIDEISLNWVLCFPEEWRFQIAHLQKYIFIYLVASSFSCIMWDFSLQALAWLVGAVFVGCRLSCPAARGIFSSPTRDWILLPQFAGWILNHWTTREAPQITHFWFLSILMPVKRKRCMVIPGCCLLGKRTLGRLPCLSVPSVGHS